MHATKRINPEINGRQIDTPLFQNASFSKTHFADNTSIVYLYAYLITYAIKAHVTLLSPPRTYISDMGWVSKTLELINLRALKFSPMIKIYISQYMDKIFCVEFQKVPLKFHKRYLAHTLKDTVLYNSEILRALRLGGSDVFERSPVCFTTCVHHQNGFYGGCKSSCPLWSIFSKRYGAS